MMKAAGIFIGSFTGGVFSDRYVYKYKISGEIFLTVQQYILHKTLCYKLRC